MNNTNVKNEFKELNPIMKYGIVASILMIIFSFLPVNDGLNIWLCIKNQAVMLYAMRNANFNGALLYLIILGIVSYFWFYIGIVTIIQFFRMFKLKKGNEHLAIKLYESYFGLIKNIFRMIVVFWEYYFFGLEEHIAQIPSIIQPITFLFYGAIAIIGIIIFTISKQKVEILKTTTINNRIHLAECIIMFIVVISSLLLPILFFDMGGTKSAISLLNGKIFNSVPMFNGIFGVDAEYVLGIRDAVVNSSNNVGAILGVLILFFVYYRIVFSLLIRSIKMLILPIGYDYHGDCVFCETDELPTKYIRNKQINALHINLNIWLSIILIVLSVIENVLLKKSAIDNTRLIVFGYSIIILFLVVIALIVLSCIAKRKMEVNIAIKKSEDKIITLEKEYDQVIVNEYDDLSIKTAKAIAKEKLRNEREERRKEREQVGFKKRILKIVIWVLVIGIAGGCLYYFVFSEKAVYNREIGQKYTQVNETLTNRLIGTRYSDFDSNKKIEYLRFNGESGEDKILEVFYEGSRLNQGTQKSFDYDGSATYKVLEQYYNSLVDAEESNNMITYLDALNQVFETMEYQNSEWHDKIEWTNVEKNEENVSKILELFAIDTEDDNIVKQVGFLPYNIELTSWNEDHENHIVDFTYKIHGISYCETKDESQAEVSNDENLIMKSDYDKNHIATYYRDITINSSIEYNELIPNKQQRLKYEILMLIDGVKNISDFTLETTFFKSKLLLGEFNNMLNTQKFNYTK